MKKTPNQEHLDQMLHAYQQQHKSFVSKPLLTAKNILPIGAAMFGMMNALDAAIVYSGVQNVSCALAGNTNRCYANINLAGGNDVEIHRNHAFGNQFIQIDEFPGGGIAINGFHAQVAGLYVYPYANGTGVAIGPAGPWGFQTGQANSLSEINNAYPNDRWTNLPNGSTRFVGLRGTIGGNTHYGWMRLTKNGFGNFTIVDWAYEDTPNTPITTGATASATADLRLSLSANDTSPAPGQTVTFTLTVTNDGPDEATGVEVKNILPAGIMYVPNTQTGPGTYNNSAPATTGLRWQGITIPANGSVTLTYQALVTATMGSIVNFSEIQASAAGDPDSTPGNGQ